MKNPACFLSLLSLILLALLPAAARAQAPITTAERTDYAQTSTHAEVMAFVEHLAADFPAVTLDILGTSTESRDLPLLIIADPPITTAEQARDSGKLVALLLGNIHGGEVCGKEALLMLARELATDPDHPLLDDLIICIAPLYNADGNEHMAPGNRPGQIGPDQMGTRTNAQGLDLNRDFIKAEAPETRALLRFFRTWNPDLFIDAHTTNGSYHRYPLTYAGPKHPGGDLPLLEYTRDHLLPRVAETLRQTKNLDTFPYGNFADDHTQWTTYPAAPRYSTNYAGMRNTIGILSEAYSYVPFKQRVLATLDFCRAVLDDVAAHRDEIAELRTAAADRAADGSSRKAPTPIRTKATALPGTRTALGYVEVEHDGRMIATDETAEYEVEVIDNFVGTLAIKRPWAYLLPADREDIATHLQRHGLIVEIIREDVLLDAGVYTYDTIERAQKPFQGHRMV
ncbi:Gll2474 protein, partial [hydrothermal vent metagenome]